jgi:hypothetical protein
MKLNAVSVYQPSVQPLFQKAEVELQRLGQWPADPEERLKHMFGTHLFTGKGATIRASSPVLLSLLGHKPDKETPGEKYALLPPVLYSDFDTAKGKVFASEPIIRVCTSFCTIHPCLANTDFYSK